MRTPIARYLPLLLSVALTATATPAFAHHKPGHAGGPPSHQNNGSNSGTHSPESSVTVSPAGISVQFGEVEIRLVNDWFRANPDVYANYAALPPGIARNLERGKPLPPGIAKRFLPSGLTTILPAAPEGYGRFIIGNDLVLIELNSGLISDLAEILF